MTKQPTRPVNQTTDPVDIIQAEAIPLDKVKRDPIPATTPKVATALDDDEGGADPVDPDTGLPYDETDPGPADS